MMFDYYTKFGLALIAVALFIFTVVTYPSKHDAYLELIETRIINDNKLTIYSTLDDCINFSRSECNERILKVFVEQGE
jgi:hypothetical protein